MCIRDSWGGDYSGGVRVSGPNLVVEGDLDVDKNVKIGDCLTIGSKNGGGHQLCSDGSSLIIKGAGGSSKPLRLFSGNHSSVMTTRVDNSDNWFGY